MSPRRPESLNEYGLTPKQDAFAIEYVANGGNAAAAYSATYNAANCSYKVVCNEASLLMKHEKVLARVNMLKAKLTLKTEVSLDRITDEYEHIRIEALSDKSYASALGAVTGKAKLHGFLKDNVDITSKGEQINPDTLSPIDVVKALLFRQSQAEQKKNPDKEETPATTLSPLAPDAVEPVTH